MYQRLQSDIQGLATDPKYPYFQISQFLNCHPIAKSFSRPLEVKATLNCILKLEIEEKCGRKPKKLNLKLNWKGWKPSINNSALAKS